MACSSTDPPAKVTPLQIGNSPAPLILNFFNNSTVVKLFTPLRQEMAASAFFTHGYFQEAHVHISEAITTD